MASYTYAEIRAGLVAALAPLGIQSTGYILGAPLPPSIEVFPGRIEYDQVFQRGYDELEWIVRITVAAGLAEGAQLNLDRYLHPTGALSVKTLLEADKTLDGAVTDLWVQEASGFQVAVQGETRYLSCDWTVRIYA